MKPQQVAKDKAIAAVTAISMVKIPDQKKVKLNNRDAGKFWPPSGQEELRAVSADAALRGQVLCVFVVASNWSEGVV